MVEKKTTRKGASAKKSAPAARAKKPAKAAPKKAAAAHPPTPPPAAAPPPSAPKKQKPVRAPRKQAAAPAGPAPFGIHDLAPAPGSTHYRKRVGRGPGSGHGKTAGKGNKGQKSRTGYRHLRGFEGGQMPLHRRVPKRGFTNIFRVEYDVVNLSDLARFEAGQAVNPETLAAARLSRRNRPVKILGDGEVGKALTVSAHKFSAGAQAKIEKAGGRCEVIPR
jgi:large subunit ribosomal protein L15